MRSNNIVFCILLALPVFVFAQQSSVEQAATYVSELDSSLTIRRVSLLPVTDNIDGIYSRPIENKLKELIKSNHRFDFTDLNVVGQILTPQDLENSPEQVKKLIEGSGSDATLAVRVTRGPNGVTIVMDMFLASDGKLILQETLKDHPQFELKDIQNQVTQSYQKLIQKIPYSGLVLSRTNNRVTLNLGKKDGIAAGNILSAILLIKANRHPKFHFLISTEREVLGKIKIEKIDETISFGVVVTEKAKGAIAKNTKLTGLDFIKYEDSGGFISTGQEGLNMNDDANKLVFGNGAQEWIPAAPPTFGKVGLMIGFGSYDNKQSLESTGSVKGANPFFPSVRLDGELWLTPEWNVITLIRQGITSVTNGREGSSPKDLSVTISRYSFYAARNFLIKGDFFGPKIQAFAGFSKYSSFVDASSPIGLTSTSYSGLVLGLKGEVPIDDKNLYTLGASFELFLWPGLNESPVSSGDKNSNSVNSFSIYGNYLMTSKLRAVGALDFESYTTTFSGDGTRGEKGLNASQRLIILSGGIEYMF